ncbi:MAG: hypothetical protein V5B30_02510 [Candidatus Accumulibacter delftensis]|jgi:hypothetical protein
MRHVVFRHGRYLPRSGRLAHTGKVFHHAKEEQMQPGSSGDLDWGAIALLALIVTGLVSGLRFVFRQNRKDLESLQETLQAENEDDPK